MKIATSLVLFAFTSSALAQLVNTPNPQNAVLADKSAAVLSNPIEQTNNLLPSGPYQSDFDDCQIIQSLPQQPAQAMADSGAEQSTLQKNASANTNGVIAQGDANQTQRCNQAPPPPATPARATVAPSTSVNPIVRSTSFTVSVNSVSRATLYEIYQKINAGSYVRVSRSSARSKSLNISSSGTAYFRYRGCNSGGCGSYSPVKTVSISQGTPPPPPPPPVSAPQDDGVLGLIPSHLQSNHFGAVPGEASVSGGAASYSIPITLVPGRAGMQPAVSLSYSSRQGVGIVGVGWSLSAGGSISRCPQTNAQDGQSLGVTFSVSNDRLCLNGQRLMLVSGVYGQAGAIYAYEMDDNTRITQYGSHINSSASYFVANQPNGHQHKFGNSNQSQLIPLGKNAPLRWLLSEQKDVSRHNNVKYTYTSGAAGEKLLSNIRYTGNGDSFGDRGVYFHYENKIRPSVAYLAGGKTQATKRLKQINTKYGSDTVREYHLNYTTSNTTQRDILKNVELCGYTYNGSQPSTRKCAQKTQISTHMPSTQWAAPNTTAILGLPTIGKQDKVIQKDINGDGVSDVILLKKVSVAPQTLCANVDSDPDFDYDGCRGHFNVSVYSLNSQGQYELENDNLGQYQHLLYAGLHGDLNHDGITDFAVTDGNQLIRLQFDHEFNLDKHNTGFYFNSRFNQLNAGQGAQFVDMDGDGYQDIVFTNYGDNGTPRVVMYRNLPNAISGSRLNFSGYQILYTLQKGNTFPYTAETAQLMDINGDGLLDILMSYTPPDTASTRLRAGIAQRTGNNGLSYQIKNASTMNLPSNVFKHQTTWADMNGDGLVDFVKADETSGRLHWSVQLNEGDTTFASKVDTGSSTGIHRKPLTHVHGGGYRVQATNGGLRTADIDNDGMDELIVATHAVGSSCATVSGELYNQHDIIVGYMHVEACDDDLYLTRHNNTEPNPRVIDMDMSRFDYRLFSWSGIDMRVSNGQVKHSRTLSSLFSAPISTVGLMTNNGDRQVTTGLQLTDINNDGLVDVSYSANREHEFSHSFSIGGYLVKHGFLSISSATTAGYFTALNQTHSVNQLADTVSAIDNGVGLTSEWHYAAMSSQTPINGELIYSVPRDREQFYIDTDPAREHFYFTSSMPLVTRFFQSNGVGGKAESRYRYAEAVYNSQGRGFMGFRGITTENIPAKRKTTTIFKQMFPYVSVQEAQYQFVLGSDALLSATCNEWSLNSSHQSANNASLNMVYPSLSASYQYDFNDLNRPRILTDWPSQRCSQYVSTGQSALIARNTNTINAHDVDRFGNVLRRTAVQVDADYGTTTVTTRANYDEATQSWPHKQSAQSVSSAFTLDGSLRSYFSGYLHHIEQLSTQTMRIDSWDDTHRKPRIVTVDSGTLESRNARLSALDGSVTSTTAYNYYGLPTKITVTGDVATGHRSNTSGAGITTQNRVTDLTYSKNGTTLAGDGYFVLKTTVDSGNTLSSSQYRYHATTTHTQPHSGQVVKSIAPNGVSQSFAYDHMSRPIQTLSKGYKASYIQYSAVDNVAPAHAVIMASTHQVGSPSTYTYQDSLGRSVRESVIGFDGTRVHTDTQYTDRGLLNSESMPYKHGSTPKWTTYPQYDDIGRIKKKVTLGTESDESFSTLYEYVNTQTSINTVADDSADDGVNDGADLSMSRRYSASGLLLATTDAKGGITRYAYNARQQPVVITDAASNSIVASYDVKGRKVRVNDPNQGVTAFTYNDFGELESEYDANLQTLSYDYDLLGRVTKKYMSGGYATFEFDTASVGQLAKSTRLGSTVSYTFDSIGRIEDTTTTIDGTSYKVSNRFDNHYGRLTNLIYPSQANLNVQYQYNSHGYLHKEVNAVTNYVYREITNQNQWGNITASRLGNNRLTTNTRYSDTTGQMLSTKASRGSRYVHDWQYTNYDSYGNLMAQSNTRYQGWQGTTMDESFTYDKLHRLETSSVNGLTPTDYAFDAVGNIKNKSDFSENVDDAYTYHNGSNKLASVKLKNRQLETYIHDNKGNLTHRNGIKEFTYNAMNKPTRITRMGNTLNLYYGADDMRYKQVRSTSSGTTTTHYIGKLFEVVIKGATRTYKSYISDVAIASKTNSTTTLKFTLNDRLGSATTITNDEATQVTYRNFDAFGKPRGSAGNISHLPYGMRLNQYNDDTTRRGYTDHEHLDDVEIIHMNGRVYDYNVGRFLSVDPYIQAPGNSQSINPYSYVMNNPLAGTDPTGYKSVCGQLKGRKCDKVVDYSGRNSTIKSWKNNGFSKKYVSSISIAKNEAPEDTLSIAKQNELERLNNLTEENSNEFELYNGLDFEHVALTASTDPDDDRWWQGAVYTGIVIHNLFSKYVENVLGMVANSTLAGLFNGRPDAVDMTDSIEGLIYELKPLTYMNKPRRNAADMQLSNYLFEAWLNDKLNMRLGDSHSITQGKESMMIGHVVNYKMQKLAVTLWVDNKRDSGLVFYSTRVVSDRREAFKRGFTELSENLKDVLKYMPPVGPRMIPKRQ